MKRYPTNYNLEEVLVDLNVDFRQGGKNVSSKWFGIEECPFCGIGNCHLGVSPSSKSFNCFSCGSKGSVIVLLKKLGYTPEAIETAIRKAITFDYEPNAPIVTPELKLDNLYDKNEVAEAYLKGRGYIPKRLQKIFGIKYGGVTGFFKYRIVAPVVMNYEVVNAVGRDFTGLAKLKYKTLPEEQSKTPIKQCLYNLDSCKDSCIIVEGITDVWRIGNGCVATFGKVVTNEQLELLIARKFKKVVVLLDPDAKEQAEKLAFHLKAFSEVTMISLRDKDPGELTAFEVMELKHQVGIRV